LTLPLKWALVGGIDAPRLVVARSLFPV